MYITSIVIYFLFIFNIEITLNGILHPEMLQRLFLDLQREENYMYGLQTNTKMMIDQMMKTAIEVK